MSSLNERIITATELGDLLVKNGICGLTTAGCNQHRLSMYPKGRTPHGEDELGVMDIPATYSKQAWNSVRIAHCIIAHQSQEIYDFRILQGPVQDIDYLRASNNLCELFKREEIPYTNERDTKMLEEAIKYQMNLSNLVDQLAKQG